MKYKIFGSILVVVILIVIYAVLNSGGQANPDAVDPSQTEQPQQ